MCGCTIIDTFPAFLTFWHQAQQKPTEAQIEGWASEYMSQWPELLQKQLEDYIRDGVDWREIAREKVFPFMRERLPATQVARGNLLQSSASIYSTAQQVLGFESDAIFVIYVGIGCGAGWATLFRNSPAILFGLENIAECGWSRPPSLTGLVAHEIGHLVHHHWRAQYGMAVGSGPWWQLYSEGFAQRCEHVILGQDTWHQATGVNNDDWLDWCQEHKGWLAATFLDAVDADEPVRPFFGSWYDIRGRRQCGYFLGHELIMELEAKASLKEIALFDGMEEQFRRVLAEFAQARTER
jgi:hypothetical protein